MGLLRALAMLAVGAYVFASSSRLDWIAGGRALRWRAIDHILLQLDDVLLNATRGDDAYDGATHVRACRLLMTPADGAAAAVAVDSEADLQLPRLGLRIALWLYVGHEVALEALQTTSVGLLQSAKHAYNFLSVAWRDQYYHYSHPSECRSEAE